MAFFQALVVFQQWVIHHWWVLLIGWVGCMLLSFGFRRRTSVHATHGSARWGTLAEAKQAGLTRGPGVVMGKMGNQVLRLGGEKSVLVVGPARSGKTSTVVRPTLEHWPGSKLVLDLKGTLGHGPYIFAPSERRSEHINVLDAIRWGHAEEVTDVARVAGHVIKASAKITSDAGDYYRGNARLLLRAVVHALGHTTTGVNLTQILGFFSQHVKPLQAVIELQKSPHATVEHIATYLLPFREDLGAIWTTVAGFLMPWLDPLLSRNTADTTFPWRELQTGKDPMTLFLRLKPDDLQMWPFLLPLLLDQFLLTQTYRPPRAYRHRLLVALDDMAELGYTPIIEHIPAFYGEHGLRLLAVGQSFDQFWDAFGQHFSLLDNSAAWVLFRPSSPPSSEFIARKLGKTTVTSAMERRTKGWGRRQRSVAEVSTARDLLTSGEVQQLTDSQVAVCVGGMPPLLAETIRYDEEVRL